MSNNNSNNRIIAVTGGTGTIGKELLKRLSAMGANVRAFTRNPERGEKLPGIEWISIDLADKDELTKNLNGVDTLFLLTGNESNMVYIQKNCIEASVEAGVKKIVKLSALGASEYSKSTIGLWHYIVEQRLLNSGLEWTILRPHSFMQNFLEQAEDIKKGYLYSSAGDGEVPFIDIRDIADVAAEILVNGGWNGKKLVLTGQTAISFDEVAEAISNKFGKKVQHIDEDIDKTWLRLRKQGKPISLIAGQLALYNYWRKGGATAKTSSATEQVTGDKPRTINDFLEYYKNILS